MQNSFSLSDKSGKSLTEIQIFENSEFGQVRTLLVNNEPYFVGKDVADILGYSNSRKALADHVDDEDKTSNDSLRVNGSNMTLINESGLYSLILSSKLPGAKKFKHWVTSEVLPSIRNNGGYIKNQENLSDSELIAKALIVANNVIAKKDELIQEQKKAISNLTPDAESWRAFAEKDGTFCVTKVASCLGLQPKDIFKYLDVQGFASHRSGRWEGTVLGTSIRGYISNDIVAGEKYSAIQMRLTAKGMKKIAEAFGKTSKSIEETADKWLGGDPSKWIKAE